MKKIILLFGVLLINLSALAAGNNDLKKEEGAWRIGGKIHFEEKNGFDYMGLGKINKITRSLLQEIIQIDVDSCDPHSKILLKKEAGKIHMTHYEEKSRPGMGEEMHATLLYTQPRGFHSSETLQKVCPSLFEKCDVPPSIESVAKAYTFIMKPTSKFNISEIVLTQTQGGPSFIMAKLLFEGHETIYKGDAPVSAGLHMTLVNCVDDSILGDKQQRALLIEKLNNALKGKTIKIAEKNGVADLEFGISGVPGRLRAGERVKED